MVSFLHSVITCWIIHKWPNSSGRYRGAVLGIGINHLAWFITSASKWCVLPPVLGSCWLLSNIDFNISAKKRWRLRLGLWLILRESILSAWVVISVCFHHWELGFPLNSYGKRSWQSQLQPLWSHKNNKVTLTLAPISILSCDTFVIQDERRGRAHQFGPSQRGWHFSYDWLDWYWRESKGGMGSLMDQR